jgi:hypothetical protein
MIFESFVVARNHTESTTDIKHEFRAILELVQTVQGRTSHTTMAHFQDNSDIVFEEDIVLRCEISIVIVMLENLLLL